LRARAVEPAPGLLRQTAKSCDSRLDPRLSWSNWGGFGRPFFFAW